jgi:hypothetical protein
MATRLQCEEMIEPPLVLRNGEEQFVLAVNDSSACTFGQSGAKLISHLSLEGVMGIFKRDGGLFHRKVVLLCSKSSGECFTLAEIDSFAVQQN